MASQPFTNEGEETASDRWSQDIATALAILLDTAFYIPGTRIRVGLDPILGLVPGFGDTLANLIGSSLLFLGAQVGVPRIVLLRMGLNVLVNGLIGAIPGLGDLFSISFKSNLRNLELLRRHSRRRQQASTVRDWAFVVGIFAALLVCFLLIMLATIWGLRRLWDLAG